MADGSLALSGEPFPSQEPFPVRAKLQREQGGHMQGQTISACEVSVGFVWVCACARVCVCV